MSWHERITIEPGKRGGKACIRGLRIAVYDILEYLASGMSEDEILTDFPDLEREDIRAVLAFAAERERKIALTFGGVKLLFDENLSHRLVRALADLYPGFTHVREAGLERGTDAAVWTHAVTHGYAIVSKDSGFPERSLLEAPIPASRLPTLHVERG